MDPLTEIRPADMPALRPVPIRTKRVHPLIGLWRWLTTTREWDFTEDWWFTLPDGSEIKILAGFRFDGASIPRPLWPLITPTGLLLIPSVLHDYGYKFDRLELARGGRYAAGAGRAFWDRLCLREVATSVNGFPVVNWCVWLAVRAGGWWPWWQHRRRERREERM